MGKELGIESRWRFWTSEEAQQKATIGAWVGQDSRSVLSAESHASWQGLAQAGEKLGERWEPFLAQSDDFMQAWFGVLEDQQEKVAYLWAHMGRRGQSAADAVAQGLPPLTEPLRCYGRPISGSGEQRWLFMPPRDLSRDNGPIAASLQAAAEPGAIDRIFAGAQAAWERDALKKHIDAARGTALAASEEATARPAARRV